MKKLFVGRNRETSEMLSIWNGVLDQDSMVSRLIIVEGEAGVGKTTLVTQFIQTLQQQETSRDNVWIGKGACEIFEEAQIAYLPFFQVLESVRIRFQPMANCRD